MFKIKKPKSLRRSNEINFTGQTHLEKALKVNFEYKDDYKEYTY
jgi:hypothetical protein